jgi:hypothetical protein
MLASMASIAGRTHAQLTLMRLLTRALQSVSILLLPNSTRCFTIAGSGARDHRIIAIDGTGAAMKSYYARAGVEPTLDEVLEEPIVRLVMRRDGVARHEVRELVEHIRGQWHLTAGNGT